MNTQCEKCYIPYCGSNSIPYLIDRFIFSENVYICSYRSRETYLIYLEHLIELLIKNGPDELLESDFYKSAFQKF